MSIRTLHSTYYRDRQSEYDLCHDFPGDEILIDGLHAMQSHMWNNGVNIDIPVVRVMNTAHFLAAYMFATTCSGDQLEYDAMANMNLGSLATDQQNFLAQKDSANGAKTMKAYYWKLAKAQVTRESLNG